MKKKQKISALFILVLCSILLTACPYNVPPYDRTPGVGEDINLWSFMPFRPGNRLATLPGDASLRFSENLPRIDGATALFPVYAAFVQATYPPQAHYNDLWDTGILKATTTRNAFTNLVNGEVDVVFAAAPSPAQIAAAAGQGKTFDLTPIGKDAFVFFVHRDNPVNNLTIEQIQGIYSGRITNWREVGGRNERILAYQRPADSGSQTALEFFMGGIPLMNPPIDQIPVGMGMIIDEVARHRNHSNAIGFSFLFFATEMVRNNEIRLLAIEGVLPTRETIQAGTYPFAGSFYAITAGNETENTRKLIDWVLSDEGQYLIEKTGYVSITAQ